MSATKLVYSQFKRPTGLLGTVVGHLMALKNGRRGRWVVELLHSRRECAFSRSVPVLA